MLEGYLASTISGSFQTVEGETGTLSTPVRVEGNQLCVGEGSDGCHSAYAIDGGFMEVNADGSVHAVSRLVT